MASFGAIACFELFLAEVRSRKRYFLSHGSRQFLDAVAETSNSRISELVKGSRLWRAQLGSADEPSVCTPFLPERMVPRADRAHEGRINPKGIPCLYLATTIETAMSEVRPWVDSKISVAVMETTRDLRLIDCTKKHTLSELFWTPADDSSIFDDEPTAAELERLEWIEIDRAFARPVTRSDDTADYAATQILEEVFKSAGADGIAYRSQLSDGNNIALFELNAATVRDCQLYRARTARFEFVSAELNEWGFWRTPLRSCGDNALNAWLSPRKPHRPVAVKRLRRFCAALRSLRDDCAGAMGRFAIKAFDARNRPRAAGFACRKP